MGESIELEIDLKDRFKQIYRDGAGPLSPRLADTSSASSPLSGPLRADPSQKVQRSRKRRLTGRRGTPLTYLHYSSPVSLYSGKTRAYLRFKGIPFRDVTASISVYRNIILPKVGRPVIPVVETPEGEILQDTTLIIDALEARFEQPSIYPQAPWQRLVALLMEVYADEWLVMPAMHYRWQFKRDNLLFLLQEFGQTGMPLLPRPLAPLLGAAPAYLFGSKYEAYFGITKRMYGPLVRSYEALLADLDRHFEQHRYLLGDRPSIGDFGLIAPFYAHLYRDPYPGRMMRRDAPAVARWVERMQNPPTPKAGEFLPDDRVPETLHPILRRMFEEQLPVLVDTARALGEWAESHPDRVRVSRVIGEHAYRIGGVQGTRKITPFSLWMFQRPLDHYARLSETDRERIDPILRTLGGLDGMQTELPARLAMRDHRVVMEGR